MSHRRTILVAGLCLSLGGSVVLACDADQKSGGSSGDTTFNGAGGGGPVRYQPDGGVAKEPVDASPPSVPTCGQYCSDYEATCGFGLKPLDPQSDAALGSGTNGYFDKASCLAICNGMPAGDWTLGENGWEASKNATVLCRFAALHAASTPDPDGGPDVAAQDARDRCAVAGPVGSPFYGGASASFGSCGGGCPSYCTLALSMCAGDAGPEPFWSDGNTYEACLNDCQRVIVGNNSYPNGLVSKSPGTMNCRFFALESTTTDPNACQNVGGNVPAGSPCATPF